jgi:glycosyltransferase involved in cell wall biosynthesis
VATGRRDDAGGVVVRVGFDVAPLVLDNAGTARYVRGIRDELRTRVELDELHWGGAGRALAALRDVAWYPLLLPVTARKLDVLHCTTFRAPLRASVPVVVTVHDLAVLHFPEHFPAWTRLYGKTTLKHVLRNATRILAVSEFTKRDVSDTVGIPLDQIDVAYNAVDHAVFTPDGDAAEGNYVLAVGTLEPRKNLPRLIEATAKLGIELRIAGSRGWGDVQTEAAHVKWVGRPSDAELAVLLRGASCLAYPSLWEGFGIPVLEAMACGAPVVTSEGSAMSDVAAGAAELVDPRDVDAIAAGIERAVSRREELRAAGLERAAGFTWAAAADAVVESYRRAV